MSNEETKVTRELTDKIMDVLSEKGIKLQYKLWEDEDLRDLGEPILLDASDDLDVAIDECPSYEEGGCVEIVTDDEYENCIYHLEKDCEYFYVPTLIDLGIEIE